MPKQNIIGGEQPISPAILFKKSYKSVDKMVNNLKPDFFINYTFGAHYSLLAIIDQIKNKIDPESYVLLPSYLCPTMLIPFKERKVNYRFYAIDEELFVDLDDLKSRICSNVKAVLFIDYFGVSQKDRLSEILNILQDKKIPVIQDMVQCIDISRKNIIGDFAYNSFRKYLPFEGSILISKEEIHFKTSRPPVNYLFPKRLGQITRHYHLRKGWFKSSTFLSLFQKADRNYYKKDILKMPKAHFWLLNKINFEALTDIHIAAFLKMKENLHDLMPELLKTKDFIPFGFVVKLRERDAVRKDLFKQNVFAPIHWDIPVEAQEAFLKSGNLARKILTIPLKGLNNERIKIIEQQIKKKHNESIS